MNQRIYRLGNLDMTVSDYALKPVKYIGKGRPTFEVDGDIHIKIQGPGYRETIVIPEGFHTDLASIPSILMPIMGQPGHYMLPSIIHDYFCVQKAPRWFTNAKFRTINTLVGTKDWKTRATFWAVQLFGYASPISGWFTRRNVKRVDKFVAASLASNYDPVREGEDPYDVYERNPR